jgi:hypothetical protein
MHRKVREMMDETEKESKGNRESDKRRTGRTEESHMGLKERWKAERPHCWFLPS